MTLPRNPQRTGSDILSRARVSALEGRQPLVSVRELATYLSVEPSWVYDHADELGAIRLGSGPKARLRFSLETVDARLNVCHAGRMSEAAEPARAEASRRRRSPGLGSKVELLPIRGRSEAA